MDEPNDIIYFILEGISLGILSALHPTTISRKMVPLPWEWQPQRPPLPLTHPFQHHHRHVSWPSGTEKIRYLLPPGREKRGGGRGLLATACSANSQSYLHTSKNMCHYHKDSDPPSEYANHVYTAAAGLASSASPSAAPGAIAIESGGTPLRGGRGGLPPLGSPAGATTAVEGGATASIQSLGPQSARHAADGLGEMGVVADGGDAGGQGNSTWDYQVRTLYTPRAGA